MIQLERLIFLRASPKHQMMGLFSRPPKFSPKTDTTVNIFDVALEETVSFTLGKDERVMAGTREMTIPVFFPEITLTTSQRAGTYTALVTPSKAQEAISPPQEIEIEMMEPVVEGESHESGEGTAVEAQDALPVLTEVSLESAMPPQNEIEFQAEQGADPQSEADLPYLFSTSNDAPAAVRFEQEVIATPVIPQFSSQNTDELEVLKKTLSIREQDVAVLSAQLTHMKAELAKHQQSIRNFSQQSEDFQHQLEDKNRKIEGLEREVAHAGKNSEAEIEQLKFDLKSKTERVKFLEEQLEASATQYDRLRERVRSDIRKIRMRERELENKLEILKKDSETLITSRESKILELKRRIDVLEFNYDVLMDQNDKEKQKTAEMQEKLQKVMRSLKGAMDVIVEDAGAKDESRAA